MSGELIVYLVQLFIVFAMWSMLYKENILFRFFSYSFVSIAAALTTIIAVRSIIANVWTPLRVGTFLVLIPTIAGILIFTNQIKKYYWISKYPLFFIMGIGTALAIRGAVSASIVGQILSLARVAQIGSPYVTMNNIIVIVFCLMAFLYFFFHFVHKSSVGRNIQKLGRWAVFVWVGVGFGAAIMYNITFVTYIITWIFILGPPPTVPIEITALSALVLVAIVGIGAYVINRIIWKRTAKA